MKYENEHEINTDASAAGAAAAAASASAAATVATTVKTMVKTKAAAEAAAVAAAVAAAPAASSVSDEKILDPEYDQFSPPLLQKYKEESHSHIGPQYSEVSFLAFETF